ncbi:MAG: DUF3566 domain-containing protein [Actinomycetota bacterium]|nr:DUF3566 domain-containing protein [Actinomycetota bacterium]
MVSKEDRAERFDDPATVVEEEEPAAQGAQEQPTEELQEQPARSPQSHSYAERTDVVPRSPELLPLEGDGAVPVLRRRAAHRAQPEIRRVRRTVSHVDLFSVLKVSLFYWTCMFVLWLCFVAVVYGFLDGLGIFRQIERMAANEGVLDLRLDITLAGVERWATLIGGTLSLLGSLATVFLAFLYNRAAAWFGGLEVTFVERDF